MHPPLTHREERFVFEYLLDQDALAAAGRCGYSANARAAVADRLMGNPAVRERLEAEMRNLIAEVERMAVRENRAMQMALAGLGGEGGGVFPEIPQVLSGLLPVAR